MVVIYTIHTTHAHPIHYIYAIYHTHIHHTHTIHTHTLQASLTEKQCEQNSGTQDFLLARFPLPLRNAKTLEVHLCGPKIFLTKTQGWFALRVAKVSK